jgi:hypothetical protein
MRFKGKVAGRNLEELSSENVGKFMKKDARKKEKEKQVNSGFMRAGEAIEGFNEVDDEGVRGEIEKGKSENK